MAVARAGCHETVPKVLIEGPKALIEDAHSPPNLSTFGKTRSTLNHLREDIQWLSRRCSMLSEGAHYHHSLKSGDYYRAAGHREQYWKTPCSTARFFSQD
jgi:hypothetical protein